MLLGHNKGGCRPKAVHIKTIRLGGGVLGPPSAGDIDSSIGNANATPDDLNRVLRFNCGMSEYPALCLQMTEQVTLDNSVDHVLETEVCPD